MRKTLLYTIVALSCSGAISRAGNNTAKMSTELSKTTPISSNLQTTQEPLIQLALLLDTSGSMEGLVDQARCQLWNVVSELAEARLNGDPIRLEIAVYQYGTESIAKSKGCLRQITTFTEDLDEVSRGLFSLKVGGGDEFCGQVIESAVDELSWNESPGVYKAVFIAGNESFDQGDTTVGGLLPKLKSKAVFLNTVFCGTKYGGQTQWDLAAKIAGGNAAMIDHNHHLPAMPTPFDAKMRELNDEMNATFVWYGKDQSKAKKNQAKQDENADKMSDHAFAARMSTKIGHLYHHVEHDLVDALMHKHVSLADMPEGKMPTELEAKSPSDRIAFMDEMISRRKSVRRRMADLLSQRHRFLENEYLKKNPSGKVVLGDALSDAIKQQAGTLNYQFEKEGEKVALGSN